MLSVKPGATGSFYILGFVSGLFFYYSQWNPKCVLFFFLSVCLLIGSFFFFFSVFFPWQDTARFWQPGECSGTQTGTLCSSVCVCACVLGVCPSMVVLVLSVQCLLHPLQPPHSLHPTPSLSDVVCHVTQCVLRCRMTMFAEAGRCPLSLSLYLARSLALCVSPCSPCFFITTLHFNPPPGIDFHFLCLIVHLLSHSASNAYTYQSNFPVIHASPSVHDFLSIITPHPSPTTLM